MDDKPTKQDYLNAYNQLMSAIAWVHNSTWPTDVQLSAKSVLSGALAEMSAEYLAVYGAKDKHLVRATQETLQRIFKALRL